jgi:hypothetical protein
MVRRQFRSRFYLAALVLILGFNGFGFVRGSNRAFAQLASNPKLGSKDLATARSLARELGGADAELVYAARLDVIQKGSFDCLVVIFAQTAKQGKEFYAAVAQADKRYPLIYQQPGPALKSGDKFLRIGLKYEEGRSPLLRLMAAATIPGQGEMQRNVDFQFNGSQFTLIGQSVTPIPR